MAWDGMDHVHRRRSGLPVDSLGCWQLYVRGLSSARDLRLEGLFLVALEGWGESTLR